MKNLQLSNSKIKMCVIETLISFHIYRVDMLLVLSQKKKTFAIFKTLNDQKIIDMNV